MNKRIRWLLAALVVVLIALLLIRYGPGGQGWGWSTGTSAAASRSKDGASSQAAYTTAGASPATVTSNAGTATPGDGSLAGDEATATSPAGDALSKSVPTGGRIFGRVVLENGAGVADATVYLVPLEGAKLLIPDHVQSDARGEFAFSGALAGGYQLYAAKGKLLSFRDRADLRPLVVRGQMAVGPVTLSLRPAETLRLRVVDPRGKALAGAAILASGEMRLSYTTKADGEAQLLLAPGLWNLDVTARDHAPRMLALNLNGQQPGLLEIKLERAGLVFGTVRDTAKKTLEGIHVTCISASQEFTADSDGDGMFLFDKVPLNAPFTLHFSGAGYSDAYVGNQRFTLNQNQRRVDVALETDAPDRDGRPIEIAGVVLDPQRQPVAGCLVSWGGLDSPGRVQTRTNGRGQFRLKIPEPESRVVMLDALAAAFAPYRGQFLRDAPQPWELQLSHHALAGRVVDELGQPIPAAALHVDGLSAELTGAFPLPALDRVFSDNQGRFELRPLPQSIELTVNARGYARWRQGFSKADLDRDDLEIQLLSMGMLFGRVLDPQQRPVTQFTIQVALGEGEHDDNFGEINPWLREIGVQFWDRDGRFELRDLPRGTLKLTVKASGYSARLFLVASMPERDAQPVELIMEGVDQRLAGRLFDHQGKPLAGIRLQALAYDPNDRINSRFTWNGYFRGYYERKALASHWTTSGRDGSFKFEALPGEAVLDVLVADPVTALTHFSGLDRRSEQERRALKLSVARASTLAGQVDRRSFPLLRRIELESLQNQAFSIGLALDDSGKFRFQSLPAGAYRLILTAWERPEEPQALGSIEINLSEGEQSELAIDARTPLRK